MLITTSRNADLKAKRFCKYLSVFLYGVKHIPRGETRLSKIFEKSSYLGFNHLLLVSKLKDELVLAVYKRKNKEYFIDKEYLVTSINFQSTIPLSQLKKIKVKEQETNTLFLDKSYPKDNNIILKQKENHFSFLYEKKELGFSFDLSKKE